jgi:hypothetical protein
MIRRVLFGLALFGAALPAAAAQVFSIGYDMPNGGGQNSGGSVNYWDKTYSGSGCVTCDGAALAGGAGDLTDGIVATQAWNTSENLAGTGPYVGWYTGGANQANPVVTFHFGGNQTITAINIHMDNTAIGGVIAPAAILVDGNAVAFTAPSGFGWATLSGLNLTGTSHTVQFQQVPGRWAFVSEVTFEGSAVPEAATWAMLIAGFGMVGAAARRRRAIHA